MATIPLGLYLWRRIHEAGVHTIFGVPGDFNLQLLDQIYNVQGLKWVGNANELNAAYAADGYARVKNAPGCLVTTHGVGEMSAVNGIAGAMTEQVKVIHVVGQTTRGMQDRNLMIHHSVGFKPDHQVYNKATKAFRCTEAELYDVAKAPAEIDRVIRECIIQSKPVYIFIPLDLVDEEVPESLLDQPLDLDLPTDALREKSIADAVPAIQEQLYASKNPAIFVDCLVQRHNAVSELKGLVEKLRFPVYTSNMGKGIIDETEPYYVGVYNGTVSAPGLTEAFRDHDLVLVIGSLPSDTNSGGFTRQIPPEKMIEFFPDKVTVAKGTKTFTGCHMKNLLPKLTQSITPDKLPSITIPQLPQPPFEDDHEAKTITQSWIWHRIAAFLREWDVIYGETGTAAFGLPDATFPPNTTWITQTYFGSIGYATPSALGAELALTDLVAENKRPRGRTVLVTGDGSLQLTLQEIGTMIHYGLKPVVFVINNAGYTIERVIHGAKQPYNDIVPYNFAHMLALFGMGEAEAEENFHRVTTKAEFEDVARKESVRNPKKVQVVEVVMEPLDAPWRLVGQVATRGEESVRKMKEAGFKIREPMPRRP